MTVARRPRGGAQRGAAVHQAARRGRTCARFAPDALAEIAARSPLGAPAVHGLLFRVADTSRAENAFRQFGLLRPLTDREVAADAAALAADRPLAPTRRWRAHRRDARAATSVAPPGMG